MNQEEKLSIARLLQELKVDIIEAGFPIASKGDFNSVQAIAREIKDCQVAGLARAKHEDIETAWNAVKEAKNPRSGSNCCMRTQLPPSCMTSML